jgi:hypothetical protein
MQVHSGNFFADFFMGIIASALGCIFIFWREKIIKALTSSNKVFWEQMGFIPNEKGAVLLTNIMIPITGGLFVVAGGILLYRSIHRIVIYFVN